MEQRRSGMRVVSQAEDRNLSPPCWHSTGGRHLDAACADFKVWRQLHDELQDVESQSASTEKEFCSVRSLHADHVLKSRHLAFASKAALQ